MNIYSLYKKGKKNHQFKKSLLHDNIRNKINENKINESKYGISYHLQK
jgi:hypothetical protein